MGFVLVTTAGLVIWLVLWSLGSKAIDSFMITIVIVLTAAIVRMVLSQLPGARE
jgi:hypothetical protein